MYSYSCMLNYRASTLKYMAHTHTHTAKIHLPNIPMFPNMIPFSVDATLTLALMLVKSCGLITIGCGFSTSFRSPAPHNTDYSKMLTSLFHCYIAEM